MAFGDNFIVFLMMIMIGILIIVGIFDLIADSQNTDRYNEIITILNEIKVKS